MGRCWNLPFPRPPSEIQTTRLGRDYIDFFARPLSDIANPKFPGAPVETAPPGVAQSERPDFVTELGAVDKRISCRAFIGTPMIDINPKNFPEKHRAVLPVPKGSVR